MTNKKIRHRFEVNASEKDINLIKELAKLEGSKSKSKMIIELVKKRLEEIENNK